MIDTVDKNGDGKISFSEFRCVKKFLNSKYTMNVRACSYLVKFTLGFDI